jgi:hypothetical protein
VAFKQEINVPLVFTIGVVSGFLLITIVIGVQAWYLSEEQGEIEAKADTSPVQVLVDGKELKRHLEEDGPHWTDKSRKVLNIPLSQAMDLVIQNNGKLPTTQPTAMAQ